ncbi:MAG: FAD-dependent oxidoreductase [Pirellulaceae bacterium]
MRIAIIGAGVSGNVAARLLWPEHDITLFEAGDHVGGHAQTVDFQAWGKSWSVDTGFMVFNQRTYPHFCRLLDLLGVAPEDSDMSFSVRCQRTGLEYQGSSLDGVFAQRMNLLRPSFLAMLRSIVRFNREAPAWLDESDEELSLGEYLDGRRYARSFVDHYLLPMTAAVWSAPPDRLRGFPARYLFSFFRNHGIFELQNRPPWKTVSGRSRSYVEQLVRPFRDRIRLNTPIASVRRTGDGVEVRPIGEPAERFDHVVLAVHSDQALRMLADPSDDERRILGAMPYQRNKAVLHLDASLLPRRRRAWASWNYHIPADADLPVSVTYDLRRLQNIPAPAPILLTLNPTTPLRPELVLRHLEYHHPQYDQRSLAAQRGREAINGRRNTWYCGAYWGYGFHEDGVRSALDVAQAFGKSLDACTVACTKEPLSITA